MKYRKETCISRTAIMTKLHKKDIIKMLTSYKIVCKDHINNNSDIMAIGNKGTTCLYKSADGEETRTVKCFDCGYHGTLKSTAEERFAVTSCPGCGSKLIVTRDNHVDENEKIRFFSEEIDGIKYIVQYYFHYRRDARFLDWENHEPKKSVVVKYVGMIVNDHIYILDNVVSNHLMPETLKEYKMLMEELQNKI